MACAAEQLKKMETALNKIGLGTLAQKFCDEKLDFETLLAASDKELTRLGVVTIGDKVRLSVIVIVNEGTDDDQSNEHDDATASLKNIRFQNSNGLIIAFLNINSIRNKIEFLRPLVSDYVDVLIIAETKIDNTFTTSQFIIEGFMKPFTLKEKRWFLEYPLGYSSRVQIWYPLGYSGVPFVRVLWSTIDMVLQSSPNGTSEFL